ncbi:MAG TPA: alpha-ketoglutarate-dependent dioxygenase AlkB [bacterium]|nr:alpha-ketoglutarate-dependent dioxygenase AlkB [bacterium]
MPDRSEVTALLAAHRDGDERALKLLIPLLYEDLRRIARSHVRGGSNRLLDGGSMPEGVQLLPGDGSAVLHRRFLPPGSFEALRDEVDWSQEHVRVFGRTHPVPRLVAFYGEHPYTYSGTEHAARPLPELLLPLRARAEEAAGFQFNSVLCNLYRNGRDSMGWHRDNEPEIDPRCIASLSFGAARRFKLRHRGDGRVVNVELTDGSLLLMIDCQEHWEHALPKTTRPVNGRINLTFRRVGPANSA